MIRTLKAFDETIDKLISIIWKFNSEANRFILSKGIVRRILIINKDQSVHLTLEGEQGDFNLVLYEKPIVEIHDNISKMLFKIEHDL